MSTLLITKVTIYDGRRGEYVSIIIIEGYPKAKLNTYANNYKYILVP